MIVTDFIETNKIDGYGVVYDDGDALDEDDGSGLGEAGVINGVT